MKRTIWSAVLIMVLFLALAKQTSAWISERSSALGGDIKGLVSHLDRRHLDLPKHVLVGGGAVLIGLVARLLTKHRAGRFSASRLLARRGLPTPRIARRTRVAQDAVRMLKPGNLALPRRRHPGNFFRSAQLASFRTS